MPRLAVLGGTTPRLIGRPGGPRSTSPGGAPTFVTAALALHGELPAVATSTRCAIRVAGLASRARPLCVRLDASEMVSILRYRDDGEREHTVGGLAPAVTAHDV